MLEPPRQDDAVPHPETEEFFQVRVGQIDAVPRRDELGEEQGDVDLRLEQIEPRGGALFKLAYHDRIVRLRLGEEVFGDADVLVGEEEAVVEPFRLELHVEFQRPQRLLPDPYLQIGLLQSGIVPPAAVDRLGDRATRPKGVLVAGEDSDILVGVGRKRSVPVFEKRRAVAGVAPVDVQTREERGHGAEPVGPGSPDLLGLHLEFLVVQVGALDRLAEGQRERRREGGLRRPAGDARRGQEGQRDDSRIRGPHLPSARRATPAAPATAIL